MSQWINFPILDAIPDCKSILDLFSLISRVRPTAGIQVYPSNSTHLQLQPPLFAYTQTSPIEYHFEYATPLPNPQVNRNSILPPGADRLISFVLTVFGLSSPHALYIEEKESGVLVCANGRRIAKLEGQ